MYTHRRLFSSISDPHAGVLIPKRSKRGRRAASPGVGTSPQPDIEESSKESNSNLILSNACAHCQLHC